MASCVQFVTNSVLYVYVYVCACIDRCVWKYVVFDPCYTVPQIIQPSSDFHTVTFNESTSSVQLMCSLNVTIPPSVTVTWSHNSGPFLIIEPPNEVITAGSTTTLVIGDPQPSDAGLYDCQFSGLNLRRIISLG